METAEVESNFEPVGTTTPSLDGSDAGIDGDGSVGAVGTDLGTDLDADLGMDTELSTDTDVMYTDVIYTEVWLTPGPYSGLGPVYNDAGDPTGQEIASRLTQHGQVRRDKHRNHR